jgi:malic enzyme
MNTLHLNEYEFNEYLQSLAIQDRRDGMKTAQQRRIFKSISSHNNKIHPIYYAPTIKTFIKRVKQDAIKYHKMNDDEQHDFYHNEINDYDNIIAYLDSINITHQLKECFKTHKNELRQYKTSLNKLKEAMMDFYKSYQ